MIRYIACSLIVVLIGLRGHAPSVVQAVVVGGWDSSRGGDAALLTGIDFNGVRGFLAAQRPGTVLAETAELTPAFLNSIDVLMLDVVYGGGNIPIAPLSMAEQAALAAFTAAGGNVLLATDHTHYHAAGNSFVQSFGNGLSVANELYSGGQDGTIVNHVSYPAITDGPHGTVTSFYGGFIASINVGASGAAVLGTWNVNGNAGLVAFEHGAGRVVIFSDNTFLFSPNDALLQNTINYLVPPGHAGDFDSDGDVDGADFVIWQTNFPAGSGHTLATGDADTDGDVDGADFVVWQTNFPYTPGAAITVPEPSALFLAIACCFALSGTFRIPPRFPSAASASITQ